MKAALCFRGLCEALSKDSKASGKSLVFNRYIISFQKNFPNFYKFVKFNKYVDFDIYGHGWIDDINKKDNIINILKNLGNIVDIQLENQKNFYNYYKDIPNALEILKLSKGYAIKKNQTIDIFFADYFQNALSRSYSISKVDELLASNIKKGKIYDIIINVRWDLYINPYIDLRKLNMNYSYVDYTGGISPVFFGDFILITKKNILLDYFKTLDNNFKNPKELKLWGEKMDKYKQQYPRGRFINSHRLTIWSAQAMWAYYLYKNKISIEKIKHLNMGKIKKVPI